MRRDVEYRWRLSELMAANGWHNSTDLGPLLSERGIELSSSQVYRLVTQVPERVSLKTLAALCDIFRCGPEDLITVTAQDAKKPRTATDDTVIELNKAARPRRARILPDEL